METMVWKVETSWLVASRGEGIPKEIVVDSMEELRSRIQYLADGKANKPPIGEVHFRYELDRMNDKAIVVHAYFTNKHNKRARFMRLRRAYEFEGSQS